MIFIISFLLLILTLGSFCYSFFLVSLGAAIHEVAKSWTRLRDWPHPSPWSSYSVTSQVLFRANRSIYRCILSMTMGGSEFRIILCHHLQCLLPQGVFFSSYWFNQVCDAKLKWQYYIWNKKRKGNQPLEGIL